MTAAPAKTWITVRTFDTQPMAELAKITLQAAGIPCQILNAEVVSMDWLLGNAIGYIPLQVPEDQLEAADRVLGGDSSETNLSLSDCPKCGEALDNESSCPMCGHDVDTESSSEQSSEPSEQRRDDPEDDYVRSSPLEGLRSIGKTAISAYLLFFFLTLIASAFGTAMILLNGIL